MWILENYSPYISSNRIRDKYIALLEEKGLATVMGRVDQIEFILNFVDNYGERFLKLLHSKIDYNNQDNWHSAIVRKRRKAFHPLRHMLLIRFLEESPEEMFQAEKKYTPFASGPGPCLNAAVDHYKKLVIRKIEISHSADLKATVGTFICSCGYIYSRSGPDKCDSYKIGLIKSFGAV